MEPGSIDEIVARLALWSRRGENGLARVEWDSNFARELVVSRLSRERKVIEVRVPPDGSPFEKVRTTMQSLSQIGPGEIVSITGIEGLITEADKSLETLAALSFRRETLASFPVKQIWWMPATFTRQIILGVPDLDSWFQLRLHLTEIPQWSAAGFKASKAVPDPSITKNEAGALAARFWTHISGARNHQAPIEEIWGILAKPAYYALKSTGSIEDALSVLDEFSRVANFPANEKRVADAAGQDASLSKALNEYARVLSETGNYAQARQWQERLLESSRRALGDEHPGTLMQMNHLASTMQDGGDFSGARNLNERVVDISVRNLGEMHPNTLTAMNNLASTLRVQGELSKAQALQERVLSSSRSILGDAHPNTLAAINNLAATLNERHDFSGARALQEEALLSSLRVFGDKDLHTVKVKSNLAQTLQAQGDFTGARLLQEQVLVSFRSEFGEEHPETLAAMNNLALTLYSQRDLAGARALQERVLAETCRTLGDKHINTLGAMNNLASTLHDQKDFSGARTLQEKVVSGIRPLLGADHPSTRLAFNNLARTLCSQGDLAGAAALLEERSTHPIAS